MSEFSSGDVLNLFKKVYGNLNDLMPEDTMLAKDIPFTAKQKVGEKFIEGVVLTAEVGMTWGGNATDPFTINPAIAGTVKQAEVDPYMTVLPSLLPYGMISRTAGAGEKAFFEATKHVVRNNLKSHGNFQECARLHGQSTRGLGYVSYSTATYRGVAAGGPGNYTLDSEVTGGSIAFTAGVNAANKAALFAPGNFAAGIWVGKEGVVVNQIQTSDGSVVASGKVLKVDALQGILFFDFTPVAATSTTSHKFVWKGWEDSKEMIGIHKILSNPTTLFGISTSSYSLWRANKVTVASKKFSLEILQNGVANAVNRGGLDGDIVVYVNPRTWGNLVTTEAGARSYDSSYRNQEAENGFEKITFYHQTGKATIKAHRAVMEGEVIALHLPDWSRSGSAEISFKIPGMGDREEIFQLQDQAAYCFRSFSDQYVFCHTPAKSILWTGINDEATS
jgi:hypothetical protein